MKSLCVMACGVVVFASSAWGQVVTSFAELEVILDDQIQIENFEGISLHAGSTLEVPNPLNSITAQDLGFGWDLQAGVTYESPTMMAIHAGFLGGDDDVYLQSTDGVEIRFDAAQVAFGLQLLGFSVGNAYTIEVYGRDDELIESFIDPSDNGAFIGYQSPTQGISRVVISHPTLSLILVNNFTFGMDFVACPADVDGNNAHNIFDMLAFLDFFNDADDRADFTDDGQFDIFDILAFLDAFAISCP